MGPHAGGQRGGARRPHNQHSDLAKLQLTGFSATRSCRAVAAGAGRIEAFALIPDGQTDKIASVDFQGWYYGYDENGNTKRLDWHGFTKNRLPWASIGTVERAPFAVTWDTTMLPAQEDVALRAAVQFKADTNLFYLSPPTSALAVAAAAEPKLIFLRRTTCRINSGRGPAA